MIFCDWWSIIKFVQHERTIMAMVGISLVLSTASLLLLVVSYIRLKFKLATKNHLNTPKLPTTI
jgi:hypothetical protein